MGCMKNRDKKNVVKWNFIFYLMEFIYTILVGVILVPLYLAYIPKDLYGYWLATGNILSVLTLINPGFSDIIQQKVSYNYGQNNISKVGSYSSSGIILTFGFAIIILIIGLGIQYSIGSIFVMQVDFLRELKAAFGLMLVGTFLTINYYSFSSVSYAILSSKTIGLINFIGNVSGLLTTVYCLTHDYGLLSLGIASIMRGLIFLLGSAFYVYNRFKKEDIQVKLTISCIKEVFSLSIYNFFGKVGQTLLSNLNSFLSAKFVSPVEASNLKFTQTAPEFGKIIVLRILYSVTPVIPNILASSGIERLRNKMLNLIYVLLSFIFFTCIALYLFNKEFIGLWLGNNSYSGYSINVFVVLLLLFSSINKVSYQLLFALGEIKRSNKILFVQALLYLPMAIIMTKLLGIIGLLLSGVIIEMFGLFFFWGPKLLKILNFPILKERKIIYEFLKLLLVALITLLGGTMIEFSHINWGILIGEIIIVAFLFFLLLFSISNMFRNLLFSYIKK